MGEGRRRGGQASRRRLPGGGSPLLITLFKYFLDLSGLSWQVHYSEGMELAEIEYDAAEAGGGLAATMHDSTPLDTRGCWARFWCGWQRGAGAAGLLPRGAGGRHPPGACQCPHTVQGGHGHGG